MKKFFTIIAAGMLMFGTAACSSHTTAPEAAVVEDTVVVDEVAPVDTVVVADSVEVAETPAE